MVSMKRKRASATTWVALGVGAAALGIGAYFLLKPSTAAAGATKALAPSQPRPFGDPADMSSTAWACNTAWKLLALGHPREAAAWAQKCTAGGATVPTNAAGQFT
jgi:hypothetical protein